jgi:hypothetical protein
MPRGQVAVVGALRECVRRKVGRVLRQGRRGWEMGVVCNWFNLISNIVN